MKKFSILVASLAVALGFTSCETSHDDNPVLITHQGEKTEDFLNEPVMQDQYLMLTDENSGDYMSLTCSQPKGYGYAASVRYVPQVALKSDFSDYRELGADWTSLCSEVRLTNKNVAEALCELLGAKQASDLPKDYFPMYVRLKADLHDNLGALIPNTTYISNVVEFKHVNVGYLAVWVEGVMQDLYLKGEMNGWAADAAWQFHTGADKNTWETGRITMAAGNQFKVSPDTWGGQFNGVSFNAGGNGSPIVADQDYTLFVDGDSGNITINEAFTGIARLSFVGGNYILRLIPD